jgi:N-acetylglucosamine kinase-like BadF-type ATPase
MILIADSGSTKTAWCVVDGNTIVKQVSTDGMNAVLLTEQEMTERIAHELMPELSGLNIDSVYFYGAGCLAKNICTSVECAIRANITNAATVEVHTDLLGAARALCGDRPGLACILGTGSNSCFYDGNNIADTVSPLGYILGDEGSGAVLGRLLLGDVLKRQLPEHLCRKFLDEYQLNLTTIIERVYKEPKPNQFLASVSRFLCENIEEPAIHRLVLNAFKSFFVRNVAHYHYYKTLPINFVGSIAYYYKDVLQEAAAAMDCKLGVVMQTPMEGLVKYHTTAH